MWQKDAYIELHVIWQVDTTKNYCTPNFEVAYGLIEITKVVNFITPWTFSKKLT